GFALFYLLIWFFFFTTPRPPRVTLFPYTTLFRSRRSKIRATRDAPPRSPSASAIAMGRRTPSRTSSSSSAPGPSATRARSGPRRSEEHTSELQSLAYLVCRLLLEKKKKKN